MIAMLLGWTKLPQWAMELIVVGLLGLGFAAYHRAVLDKGIEEQQAADAKASQVLQQKAAQKTAALADQADKAEHAHDDELKELAAYRSSHTAQPVRLCLNSDGGGVGVPQSAGIVVSHAGTGTAGISVQHVSGGNHSGGVGQAGPDISSLLGTLAARADQVSAELREFQARKAK